MNTRRTFFKQLAMSVAAMSAPTIFIPKLIKPIWSSVVFAEPSLAQLNQFNKLPFYFARMQIHHNPKWIAWQNLLEGKIWSPNLGETTHAIN